MMVRSARMLARQSRVAGPMVRRCHLVTCVCLRRGSAFRYGLIEMVGIDFLLSIGSQ